MRRIWRLQSYVEALALCRRGGGVETVLGNPSYQDREEIPVARNMLGRCYQLQTLETVCAVHCCRLQIFLYPVLFIQNCRAIYFGCQ